MNFLIFAYNGPGENWKRESSSLTLNIYQIVTFDIAGEAGFEPTSTVLETAELPLFYSPVGSESPRLDSHFCNGIGNYSITLIT